MLRPKVSTSFDFEGELALVIGKGGRHIKAADALKHVAGYTCFCDGSVRDFTKYSLVASKNFLGTSPLGPWMVTSDEIPDPTKLTLVTRLNGKEMQRSGTDMLIHSIPAIIEFCSVFTPLSPGDIIATGTPDGIGAKQQSAGVDEGRRRAGGRDFRHRHAAQQDRGREVALCPGRAKRGPDPADSNQSLNREPIAGLHS